jgi:hypothetical protein
MTDEAGQTPVQTDQTPVQAPTVMASSPWNMYVVLVALALVSVGAIVVLLAYRDVFENATDVTTVLGSWFTVVGTIVGAYFGIKASSDATDRAQSATQMANNRANQALAKLSPETADEVLGSPTTGGSSPTPQ